LIKRQNGGYEKRYAVHETELHSGRSYATVRDFLIQHYTSSLTDETVQQLTSEKEQCNDKHVSHHGQGYDEIPSVQGLLNRVDGMSAGTATAVRDFCVRLSDCLHAVRRFTDAWKKCHFLKGDAAFLAATCTSAAFASVFTALTHGKNRGLLLGSGASFAAVALGTSWTGHRHHKIAEDWNETKLNATVCICLCCVWHVVTAYIVSC
jgi:hypothetical protein